MAPSKQRVGVAYAVVRDDPPAVFLADDLEILTRVLVNEVVGKTDPATLPKHAVEEIREALLTQQWDDAVTVWMDATNVTIDIYPHLPVHRSAEVPEDLFGSAMQFSRIFTG